MDNRRRNGAIALVVLATAVTALIYTQLRPPAVEPTTAFAPAQSADESVPPAEAVIEAPADVAVMPEDDGAQPEAEAAALDEDAMKPAADVAAAESGEPVAAPAETAAADGAAEAETAATDDAAIADATDEVAEDAVVADAVEEAEAVETVVATAPEDATEPAESVVAAAPEPAPATAEDVAPADTADAAPPAVEEPAAAEESFAEETVIALVDPGAAEEPAPAPQMAETVTLPETGVPTFDIVRVEPSGDTVIAGQAEPNATVEILDAGTVIATAEANAGGDWAIALETPLDPGTHDLAIQTTTPDEAIVMLSDQRVTVSVPEDGSGEVLVVLNEPGAPSTLIQVPPASETEVAAVDEAAEGAVEAPAVTEAVEEPAVAETEVAVAPEPATPEAEAPAAGSETAEAAPAEEPAAPDTMVAAAPAEEAPAPEAAEVLAESDAATEAEVVAEALAEAETATEEEAVDQVIAEAEAAAEVEAVAEAVDENVAEADVAIAEAETIVEAEAEAVAEAEAEAAATSEPAEIEIAAAPAVEEPPAPPPPPQPMVSVAAVEAEMDGALFVAGLAATGETVRVYLDDRYVGDAVPSPTGTWLVESNLDLPAGEYVVRVDQVAGDGTVIARSEVPFEREVEVAILKPAATASAAADAASLAGAMPELETVIIKRGDNLWRIARANWGKGIRWSVIYQANTDQIRNPNRIYPGQVFVMPKGDAAWEN